MNDSRKLVAADAEIQRILDRFGPAAALELAQCAARKPDTDWFLVALASRVVLAEAREKARRHSSGSRLDWENSPVRPDDLGWAK